MTQSADVDSAAAPHPTVVVLHGLARTNRSVAGLCRFLESNGYPTWARTYPSRRLGVEALAAEVASWIRADLGDQPLLAVTHSLGGILLRHMADQLDWRGAVLLAPPNNGSRLARAFNDVPLFRWLYGPAGIDVAAADRWPPPPEPFAVIAGDRHPSIGNPISWVSQAMRVFPPSVPSDGTVAVDETRHAGMADFAVVEASHTWIMDSPHARAMVLSFFASGRLRRDGPTGSNQL